MFGRGQKKVGQAEELKDGLTDGPEPQIISGKRWSREFLQDLGPLTSWKLISI